MKLLLDVSARVVAILWAGFWCYFFVAESIASASALGIAIAWISVGLLFVALALVPWRWERVGGLLLVTAGTLLLIAYAIWPPAHLTSGARAITALILGVPPLLAGMLFLLHRRAVLHHRGMRHA